MTYTPADVSYWRVCFEHANKRRRPPPSGKCTHKTKNWFKTYGNICKICRFRQYVLQIYWKTFKQSKIK